MKLQSKFFLHKFWRENSFSDPTFREKQLCFYGLRPKKAYKWLEKISVEIEAFFQALLHSTSNSVNFRAIFKIQKVISINLGSVWVNLRSKKSKNGHLKSRRKSEALSVKWFLTQASNWVTDTLRMPWAVEDHELVQLTDTTALIIGGVTPDNAQGRSNVFLFDKTANTYTEVNPMANPRFRHTCQKIFSTTRGEEVICVGGCPNSPKSTDIYSVSTGVWRAGPLIPDNIYDGKSVAYQNTMLVMGGTDGSGTFYTKTHEYDVVNQVWATNDAVLSEAKNDFAAILVDTTKAC